MRGARSPAGTTHDAVGVPRRRGMGGQPVNAHRSSFTREEAKQIKSILAEVRRVDPPAQKRLRQKLRSLDFYITDYSADADGFTASEFDYLVSRGTIKITD